jgi:methylthioribose-1-phosphate isomerase
MNVDGVPTRAIRLADDRAAVLAIDQTRLPGDLVWARLGTLAEAAAAIRTMVVRGAPLLGATAAYGLWLALRADPSDAALDRAVAALAATRPTAVNLRWALDRVARAARAVPAAGRAEAALAAAEAIADEDVARNAAIGAHGVPLLRAAHERRGGAGRVEVLTHCNAGWLATVDGGTALAPVYRAFDEGLPVHVWVDETRPRGQGARLTAWELCGHGVPHTLVADGAAAHLMQRGLVDLVLVGADRVTASGDVANKIGTLSKALAAADAGVPFYAALPSSTVDWTLSDGVREIPIEERSPREVTHVEGIAADGRRVEVRVAPEGTAAANPAFDVTPARLVTALVTERGVAAPPAAGLRALFPEAFPGTPSPAAARGARP